MGKADSIDPAAVLAQAGWVRRLAGRLLFDAAAADDVAQETLAAALRGAPTDKRTLRSWLGGVVRNLVRAHARSEANRGEREARALVQATPSSAADVIERGESFRLVVQAVFDLPEPYRTTVLMRYFDGLSTAQMAEQAGASTGAIRTRLSRGLALLREQLDRSSGGDARTWLAALAPLALPAGSLPPPHVTVSPDAAPAAPSVSFPRPALPVVATGGALFMSTKAILATVTIVPALVLGGLWLRSERAAPTAAAGEPSAMIAAAVPELRSVKAVPRAPSTQRVEVEAEPVETGFIHPPTTPHGILSEPSIVRGQVIDLAGGPIGGITVQLRAASDELTVVAESRNDGSFEVAHDGSHETHGTLIASDEQYAPVFNAMFTGFDGRAPGSGAKQLTLVVAPRGHFAGQVVDTGGRPLPGAELRIELPDDLRTHFDAILDNSVPEVRTIEADADGRFTLAAGCVPESRLLATMSGYRRGAMALPATSTFDLRFVLARAGESSLLGQVVDAQGRPIVGASVAFGMLGASSDDDGRFQFELERRHHGGDWTPEAVVALYPGFLPARIERASRPGGEWGGSVSLQLSERPKSITGKVVHPNGDPVAGAEVYLLNPLFFGQTRYEDSDSFMMADVEQLLNKNSGVNGAMATTGADGTFVATGLLAREYRLLVIEPMTLTRATSAPIVAPKSGVIIELEQPELTSIAGRVVDRDGEPVPGMNVMVNIVRTIDRQGLPSGDYPEYFYTQHATMTGDDGRFALPALDPTHVRLQIYRAGVVAVFHHDLATTERPLDDLEIVAYRRCHFFVELTGPPELADSFRLLDETGASVPIVFGRGSMTMHGQDAKLREGRSETVSASERACTLVLYRAGKIVERVPIRLTPDETQRIDV